MRKKRSTKNKKQLSPDDATLLREVDEVVALLDDLTAEQSIQVSTAEVDVKDRNFNNEVNYVC